MPSRDYYSWYVKTANEAVVKAQLEALGVGAESDKLCDDVRDLIVSQH